MIVIIIRAVVVVALVLLQLIQVTEEPRIILGGAGVRSRPVRLAAVPPSEHPARSCLPYGNSS
jgi:hypothetical protein